MKRECYPYIKTHYIGLWFKANFLTCINPYNDVYWQNPLPGHECNLKKSNVRVALQIYVPVLGKIQAPGQADSINTTDCGEPKLRHLVFLAKLLGNELN